MGSKGQTIAADRALAGGWEAGGFLGGAAVRGSRERDLRAFQRSRDPWVKVPARPGLFQAGARSALRPIRTPVL
jgi:hypothetical protein